MPTAALREKLLERPPDASADEFPAISSSRSLFACHAALTLAYAITAIGIVYLKHSMLEATVDSVTFSFWRFAGSTPLLLALAAASHEGGSSLPTVRDLGWFAILGSLLVFNQLFSNLGVNLAGAFIATVMQPFTPVVSAAMAVALGQERLSAPTALAFVLAVAGAVLMAAGRGESASSRSSGHVAAGFMCLLINTSSFAAYCVLMKVVVHRHGPALLTGAAQAIGMLLMGAIVLARETLEPDPPGLRLPPTAYGVLAYWVVGVSGVAYLLIGWSNRHLPASTVALHNTVQPAVGAALSVLCLGDGLLWTDLGGLGIVLGLVIVVRRPG